MIKRCLILTLAALAPSLLPAATYIGNYNTNQYDSNSVNNPYGRYGSKYSSESINNPYGRYGSKYSSESINNPYGRYGSKYSSESINNPYGAGSPYSSDVISIYGE
ncbi:MAG: hypothetical protein RR353_04780 [Victivallaceae bacterium]